MVPVTKSEILINEIILKKMDGQQIYHQICLKVLLFFFLEVERHSLHPLLFANPHILILENV